MTVHGARCPKWVSYRVDVDGQQRGLCGTHARQARRGLLHLWTDQPPVTLTASRHGEPWTEDDDRLVVDLRVPPSEVAARTGRTVGAVTFRRSIKARGLV